MATEVLDPVEEQVHALASMDPNELRDWVFNLASGKDVILESDEEGNTFYPVLALCRLAPPAVKERIEDVIVEALSEVFRRRELSRELFENLLLLAQTLAVKSARDVLEAFVASERFAALEHNLQYRVLQSLIAFDANLQPTFWYRAFKLQPDMFAGVVFDGLALVSPSHAVDFLSRAPASAEAVHGISIGLPGFMDDLVPANERSFVRGLIESRMPEMNPTLANAVADFFAAEETPIAFLKLDLETPVSQQSTAIKISPEAFPILASFRQKVDEILNLKEHNPARLLRRLAHQ